MVAPPTTSVPFENDWTAKPTTGRPRYVLVRPEELNDAPNTCVVALELASLWYEVAVEVVKPSRSQPSTKLVLMFDTFFDASRLLLLNVTMFASQQIDVVGVGDGGENVAGVEVVRSS